MTAVMVGSTIGEMVKKGKVPADVAKFGPDVKHIFILAAKLKDKYDGFRPGGSGKDPRLT